MVHLVALYVIQGPVNEIAGHSDIEYVDYWK